MRIGIDATCWANERDYGRFTRELVSALPALGPADDFVCLLDRRAADRFALTAPNVQPVQVAQQVPPTLAASSGSSRSPLDMLRLPAAPSESAATIAAAAARIGLPPEARWFMYVGGFTPHKRVDQLVRAHAAVARRHSSTPPALVLAGPTQEGFHQDLARIHQAIAEEGTADLVRWPGSLDDEELRHLHSGALALVLPSESEGFGLPAVEAASCGTPVVATAASPLPQMLDGGGLFVPPGDAGALAQALERLLTDEPARQAMGRRARERARLLSWERSAGVALDAFRAAAAPGRAWARRRAAGARVS